MTLLFLGRQVHCVSSNHQVTTPLLTRLCRRVLLYDAIADARANGHIWVVAVRALVHALGARHGRARVVWRGAIRADSW